VDDGGRHLGGDGQETGDLVFEWIALTGPRDRSALALARWPAAPGTCTARASCGAAHDRGLPPARQ
jgi:hypothetical protein